jgi:hypothetical protein
MKLQIAFLAFVLGTGLAGAQGTFVYDQQSTGFIDANPSLGQTSIGQSFTPTLDSVGFVDLFLANNGSSNSTVAVNIRSGSITGTILGTSLSVTLPSLTVGTNDFLFSAPISLTPGTKYYFEPVLVGGATDVIVEATFIQYAGGDAIIGGTTKTNEDLWFREGVISGVPEPSSVALFVVAGGVLYWQRRNRRPS